MKPQRLVEVLYRPGSVAEVGIGAPAVVVGLGRPQVEQQRLVVVLDRPGVLAEVIVGDPAAVVGDGQARIEPQHMVVVLDRPAVLAEGGIGVAAVAVGIGEVPAGKLAGADHRRAATDTPVRVALLIAVLHNPRLHRGGERTYEQHHGDHR